MVTTSPRRAARRRVAVLAALAVLALVLPTAAPASAAVKKTTRKVVKKTTRKVVVGRSVASTSVPPVTSTSTVPTGAATTVGGVAPTSTTVAPTATVPTVPVSPVATTPFAGVNRPYGPLLTNVMRDLDQFWTEQMPAAYGKGYRPLTGLYWYTSQQLPPQCSTPVTYREITNNAFYCVSQDYIAWDDEKLFPSLQRSYGDVSLAVVLAHEIGHAIQARAGVYTTTIFKELQADCFSGAWMARVFSGRSALVAFPMSSLDEAVTAVLAFRDQPGVDANDIRAHGNGFDRINALQLGYEGGVARCAAFLRQPPSITATAFASVEERQSGGNVPYAQAISVAIAGLNGYWPATVPGLASVARVVGTDPAGLANLGVTCVRRVMLIDDRLGVCDVDADGNPTVAFDDVRLRSIYGSFNDFGTGMALALGWSVLVQQKLGEPISTSSAAAELRADCYAGSWVGAMATNRVPGVLGLSPGDIDEALMLLVAVPGKAGTFDRIRSLRTGFFSGFGACRSL